jgi:hypothetical protein
MKKTLFYPLIILLAFLGCKKDNKKPVTGTDGKAYNVKFNFSGLAETLSQTTKRVNSVKTNTAPSSPDYLTRLYYLVYNSSGKLVSQISLASDSSKFAPISDKLATGTYNVFFAASHGDMVFATDLGRDKNYFFYGDKYNSPSYQWDDTFFKAITINVTNADITQNINLARIVGELEVNIEDNIPANASKLKLTITSEYSTYTFLPMSADTTYALTNTANGRAAASSVTYNISDTSKGKPNFKAYDIIINTIKPFNVVIACLDAAGNVIATTTASNITCQKNRRTILSGKLFGSSTGFDPEINKAWDPAVNTVHF